MRGNSSLQRKYEYLKKTFAFTGSEIVDCCTKSVERIAEYRNYITYLNSNISFRRENLNSQREDFSEQVVAINKLVEERNKYYKEYKNLVHEYRDILAFLELRVKGEKNHCIESLKNGEQFSLFESEMLLGNACVEFSPYLASREKVKIGSADFKKYSKILNVSKDIINYQVLKNTYEKGLADVKYVQETINKYMSMLGESRKHYSPENEEHIKEYIINLDSVFKSVSEDAKDKYNAFAYYVSELKVLLAQYKKQIDNNIDNIYKEHSIVNKEYREIRKNIKETNTVSKEQYENVKKRKQGLEDDLSGWKLHSLQIENFINEVNVCEFNDCSEVVQRLEK